MISEETHIGLEISFDNTRYQQKIARYEEFIERISPSVARLRKLGIALVPGMLWHFEIGRIAKFLWELKKTMKKSSQDLQMLQPSTLMKHF